MVKKIIKLTCIAVLAWLLFSYIDIVADNNTTVPEHSAYNVFVLGGVFQK